MRRLAFDSSGDRRSAALVDGPTILAHVWEEGARRHAERLVPLLDCLVAAHGWAWSSLDEIVVAAGPGSFTGIRIAVAAARALALGLDRPVRVVSTLEALLTNAPATVAAIDARRGALYGAIGEGVGTRLPARALTPVEMAAALPADFAVVGSGARPLVAVAGRGRIVDGVVDAASTARAALDGPAARRCPVPGPAVRPLYFRAADAVPQAA